jgi:hypothetical protein
MDMPYHVVPAFGLLLLVSLAVPPTVDGQVPTVADFAACNAGAVEVVKAGTASPTKGDHMRADRARAIAVTTKSGDTRNVVESPDPQIHGMEAEPARDATYQAAYRSCMRRRGF